MRAKLTFIFGLILLAVFLGRPYMDKFIAYANNDEKNGVKKIQFLVEELPFPDFREVTNDGKELSVIKDENKVLYIEFWATWCAPCRKEAKKLVELYKKYKDRGLTIIGINRDENKEKALQFIKEENVTWPQLFLADGFKSELFKSFEPPYQPFDFLIEAGTLKETNLTAEGLRYYLEENYK